MQKETKYTRFQNIHKKYTKKDLPTSQNKLLFKETERKHIYKTVLTSQLLTNFLLHPLQRLKIMKQTSLESFFRTEKKIKNLKYSFFCKEIIAKQGYLGFFKGSTLTLSLTFSKNFLQNFLRNKIFIDLVKEQKQKKNKIYFSYFGLIFSTNVLNRVLTYPIDRLRTLAVTETSKFIKKENFLNTSFFAKILREEKFAKICKGFNFSLFSAFPESLFIFSTFCLFKEIMKFDFFSSIFFSTFFSSFFIYPFDTVLKRFQSDSLLKGPKYFYENVNELVFKIWRNEGVFGFYRGFGVGLVNNFLAVGIFLFLFRQMYFNQICVY